MKKLLWIPACLLVVAACGDGAGRSESSADRERDSLMRIISERDNELNDIMGTFNEIQEGIRRINEAEGRITVAEAGPETASTKEAIRENLRFIQDAMQQNRDLIAQLKDKLNASSFTAEKLRQTVESLSAQLEEQKQRVQELEVQLAEKDLLLAEQSARIDSLNADVNHLSEANETKSRQVAVQDKQLNTAWFVFGTKAELKEQKILQDGDVLKSGNFNKDYFTQVDIRYDKEIKLYSKSAKLLTSHPSGSYKLSKDAKGQYVLHITNPKQFWSVSRYLVVQVK